MEEHTTLNPENTDPPQQTQATTPEHEVSESSQNLMIQFFGGVHTIGGNKIVLISKGGDGILLDFGWDFSLNQKYFDEYSSLRKAQILNDGIYIGELPIPKDHLAGLYREDLFTYAYNELDEDYSAEVGEPAHIYDVLVSHAHADHIGNVKFLHPNIKIISSNTTKTMLEYFEKVSRSPYFSDILSYASMFQQTFDQKRGISRVGYAKQQVIERRVKGLMSGESYLVGNDQFKLTIYEVDHSIPGAAAYLIEDLVSKKRIVYTGDLRLHGIEGQKTRYFIQMAKKFQPDILISEGTRVGQQEVSEFHSEQDVEDRLTDLVGKIDQNPEKGLIMFDCSMRDIWRFRSFYMAATMNDRTLVVNAQVYQLLKQMVKDHILTNFDIFNIRVFLPRRGWGIYEERDYSGSKDIKQVFRIHSDDTKDPEPYDPRFVKEKPPELDLNQSIGIRAKEIRRRPEKYLLYLPFFSMTEIFDLKPPIHSYYIRSKSEPFDDEGWIEERKLFNWFELMQIPKDHLYQVHCSGHIYQSDLVSMISTIHPKVLIPIHTEHPELYQSLGLPTDIQIIIPEKGKKYNFD